MSDKKQKFSIVIGAVDEVTMKVMEINQKLQNALAPIKKLNESFGMLGQEIGAGKFGAAISSVGSKFNNVVNEAGKVALALGAIAYGVGYFVKGTADYADSIKDASDRLGISTKTLQEWRYSALQNGIVTSELDSILTKFTKNLGTAAYQGGTAADIFNALGVKMKDAKGHVRDVETLLPEVADAMKKIHNPTLRNTVLMELFGKQGSKMAMFLGEGSEKLKQFAAEANSLGAVIPDSALNNAAKFNDTLDSLTMQFNSLKVSALSEVFPILIDVLKQLQQYIKENSGAIKEWAGQFAKDLPENIKNISAILKGLKAVLSPFVWIFDGISKAIGAFNTVVLFMTGIIAGKLMLAIYALGQSLIKLGIIAATTPIGWIAIGIGLVIAAIIALFVYWDDMMAMFVSAGEIISEAWDAVGDYFSDLWESIKNTFNSGLDFLMSKLRTFMSFLPTALVTTMGFNATGSPGGMAGGAAVGMSNPAVIMAAQNGGAGAQENKLVVTFENPPPGTKVDSERSENPMKLIMNGIPGNF